MSNIVIEGIEDVIQRDLLKHKSLLESARNDLVTFKSSRSHEIKRKRYYSSLIGGKRFNDTSLEISIDQARINIRHLSDKVGIAEESIKHYSLIVDTLTDQLETQKKNLAILADYRGNHGLLN